jgi:cytochrome d ubiquinol oxidase subunit I
VTGSRLDRTSHFPKIIAQDVAGETTQKNTDERSPAMIENLLAARLQMAISLGFHIIFAVAGMAMPLMMVIAEWRYIRTGNEIFRELAKRWAKGTAVLFAIGAVSGTVLSFELGLLWPKFMAWAGPIIGLLFSLEGVAFFTEAIFLGIYLYGWDKIPPSVHLLSGVIVMVSGVLSAFFVVLANGWMNHPVGFQLRDGQPIHITPLAAFTNPVGLHESHHMILAAFVAIGFFLAGIHAFFLLRQPENPFHQQAVRIAFITAGLAAVFQPLSGDLLARTVATYSPIKLAALEGHFHTGPGASFWIGGIPNVSTATVSYGLEIPYGLSLLLHGDPMASVTGLMDFPRPEWPPVAVVHVAFQIMIAAGFILMGMSVWGLWKVWRRKCLWESRGFLRCLVGCAPLGLIAIESGWVVTEVGRQPWIIKGIMHTSDAVTPMPGLTVPLIFFTLLYLMLGGIVLWLVHRHLAVFPQALEPDGPSPRGTHARP